MPTSTLTGSMKAFPSRAVRGALALLWYVSGTRVLLLSVPKCGTYLLRRLVVVVGVPCRRELFYNDDTTAAVLDGMLAASRGQAVVSHLLALQTHHDIARKRGAKLVFISRDPRDQVVSHVLHYRTHTGHPLHPYFRDHVPDLDDAIHAAITGFGPGPHGHLADVATFFRYFLPWKDMDGVYSTTFERLVGPRGGGSAVDQASDVDAILRHIGFPLRTPAAVRHIANLVFSSDSPTFRVGQIGGWRRYFKPDHVRAFKEVAGQLLIDLGYERDLEW